MVQNGSVQLVHPLVPLAQILIIIPKLLVKLVRRAITYYLTPNNVLNHVLWIIVLIVFLKTLTLITANNVKLVIS